MKNQKNEATSHPGATRDQQISDEGLERLQKHLVSGTKISQPVLEQWIKRYGDKARELIALYNHQAK